VSILYLRALKCEHRHFPLPTSTSQVPDPTARPAESIVGVVFGTFSPLPEPRAHYSESELSPTEASTFSRSPQVNRSLTKRLNRKVRNLGRHVSATRRAFEAVESGVAELGGEPSSRKRLEGFWTEIRQDFKSQLDLSKDVAIRGSSTINDFLYPSYLIRIMESK